MPFKRDSLGTLLDRAHAKYASLYRPLKVFSAVDAGTYREPPGGLDFLSPQLFPDTATGAYLRERRSDRVTPLYATAAAGDVTLSGLPGKAVPAGPAFKSAAGETHFTESAVRTGTGGTAAVRVKARDTGLKTNLAAGEELGIIAAIPAGANPKAVVSEGGIAGGADAETDEEYPARVLTRPRNPARYGKKDDFAAWAMDASPEVSAAREYKNFGAFGALLIQAINGSRRDGASPAANLDAVRNCVNENASPVMFEARTPETIGLNPAVTLPLAEDTGGNRKLAAERTEAYLQLTACPGARVTAGAPRSAAIDGVAIADATARLNGDAAGIVQTSILQYPYIGAIAWDYLRQARNNTKTP